MDATTRAFGIDTYSGQYQSDNQGHPIVPKYASLTGDRKPDFVIVKLSEGLWVDSNFPYVWDALASPAAMRGIYHYQRSGVSWQQQADDLLKAMPPDCQFIALDIETTGNVMDKTYFADTSRLLNYWKSNSKVKVMYYINQDVYMNSMLRVMQANYPSDMWYLDFPFWYAQWSFWKPSRSPNNNPTFPTGMRSDWKFLQFDETGDKPPYTAYGSPDVDVFNGQVSDMMAWLGYQSQPPAPQPQPTPAQNIIEVTVRSQDPETSLEKVLLNNVDNTANSSLSVDDMPEPAPVPTEPEVQTTKFGIVRTYIVKNGLTLKGMYTPATVPVNDKPLIGTDGRTPKGQWLQIAKLPLLQAFIRDKNINNAAGAHYALDTINAMWINTKGKSESIICEHTIVSWDTETKGCADLRCFMDDEDFSVYDTMKVNWMMRPDLFFKALAYNLQGHFIKVANDVDCYIPMCANHSQGTGHLYLALSEIEVFPTLPLVVTILPDALNIRSTFNFDDGSLTGRTYTKGKQVKIYSYRPIGASVFAQTVDGWICLVDRRADPTGEFFTDWHLDTDGVIP